MTIIHSYHEAVIEGDMTAEQFYNQYETARSIEVGRKYLQKNLFKNHPDHVWEVLYIDNGVAFCRSVNDYNVNKFDHDMFITTGNLVGWRRNDPRAFYRLYKELTE